MLCDGRILEKRTTQGNGEKKRTKNRTYVVDELFGSKYGSEGERLLKCEVYDTQPSTLAKK